MRKLVITAALVAASSAAATAMFIDYRSGRLEPGERLHLDRLDSSILGETRELIVRLPVSYNREPQRRYPVLYALDGSSLDLPAAESAAMMARLGLAPELIVVGIPNVSGPGRQRDYTPPFMRQDIDHADSPTGAADRFLDFLEHELVPRIERDYRTAPSRMLAGHSRGGLLVCYSLMARPALFDARFAHSPALWRDDYAAVTALTAWLASASRLETFMYLSIGSEEVPQMMTGYDRLRAALTARAAQAGVRWSADVVPGADHQTNGEWAMPLGLQAYFGRDGLAADSVTR